MGPLDREKIKNLAGTANATHSPIILSPVTAHLRISTATAAVLTPAVTGRNRCDPKRMSRAFGCTERSLAKAPRSRIIKQPILTPVGNRLERGRRPGALRPPG